LADSTRRRIEPGADGQVVSPAMIGQLPVQFEESLRARTKPAATSSSKKLNWFTDNAAVAWHIRVSWAAAFLDGLVMKTHTITSPIPVSGQIDDRRAENQSPQAEQRRGPDNTRRRAPRIKTLKGAQIISPNAVPLRCVVRNISETGACIEVYEPVLQNTFELVFDLNQARRTCRVMWRKHPRMGVQFQ
jgi:hypothetical protein